MRTRFLLITSFLFLAAQGAVAHDPHYRAPRLPDGHPDFQGNWTHTNMVPLERPKEFTSLTISVAEASKVEAREDLRINNINEPHEPADTLDARQVLRIRGQLRSSVIVDPEDGRIPGTALFFEGQARARASLLGAFDGPEQRPLNERCIASPSSVPPILLIPATNMRQIVQTQNTVVIASEAMHDARIVRMHAAHAPAAIVSWIGDSIGWWEGETLVIETTQLMPSLVGRSSPFGTYFVSPQTVVTERLTRISKEEILYAFTVKDPTYYTKPWSGETVFTLSNDRIFAFDCHEGNYSLPNALYGERVKEARAAK